MYQKLSGPVSFSSECRCMGGIFWLPIVIMAVNLMLTLFRFHEPLDIALVRGQWGPLALPWIGLWIIHLFQPVVDTPGKEALLALPYRSFSFGVGRVLWTALFYSMLFYFGWCSLALSFHIFDQWAWYDSVLPIASIYFLASSSFMLMAITRNMMHSYILVGGACIFQFMTRGGALGPLYPFHWAFPHPMRTHDNNLFLLVGAGVICMTVGHIFFANREYITKK